MKNKKIAFLSLFLCFIALFSLPMKAFAAEPNDAPVVYSAEIYDEADLLDDFDEEWILDISSEHFKPIFVTCDEYIMDYYTYFQGGNVKYNYDGSTPTIYFVINMYDRWVQIEPFPADLVPTSKLNSILDNNYEMLSNGDYCGFMEVAFDEVEKLFRSPLEKFIHGIFSIFGLGSMAVASGTGAAINTKRHNKANKVISASKYLKQGRIKVKKKDVKYIGTKTRVQSGYYRSSSSSGGAGGSRSSGGGSGRHF